MAFSDKFLILFKQLLSVIDSFKIGKTRLEIYLFISSLEGAPKSKTKLRSGIGNGLTV